MKRKIYAGAAIRDLREARGLTQIDLAKRIGVSSSYMSQIETNQRSLSGTVIVELARVLRVDVSAFSSDDNIRLAATLREVLGDPIFSGLDIPLQELRSAALHAPKLGRALIDLHRVYRKVEEKYRSLDDALRATEGNFGSRQSAFEEVRDFFHFIGNYVDSLDRAAETLSSRIAEGPDSLLNRLSCYLETNYHISVSCISPSEGTSFVSDLDRARRVLLLNDTLPRATLAFAVARHLAILAFSDAIDAVVADASFQGTDAGAVCTAALANYFAGALLMPYARFAEEARRTRHDVERLAARFGVSIEQVCHRLSTLQRPGNEGVPMYFLRVDRAGNITKRHSATRLQFARYGGACPIWNIHEAFETPDRFLVQIAEMPDGDQYLSVAHAITKGGGRFDAVRLRYAVGFGCELAHANEFVYSDVIDARNPAAVVKIGISCRLCDRADCPQRAIPPFDKGIDVNPDSRNIVPYQLKDIRS
ncbi:helix-turn-helix domain-containing protein [Microvirga sp. M2]|uniref:helix-turn-helix domain-containing protein n=1 Tax=Microvirga sp. M2 TaxID=3073270 RepID=UPI0039C27046